MRLQKYLSRTGVVSRREAERMMLEGRVRVNGTVVERLGTRIDPLVDRVEVDGRRVEMQAERWVAYHKPAGVLTTRTDPGGRVTVYDRLPPELRSLRYVGRLDRDTEGLLLLTNAGDMAHRLLHPSSGVEREYLATVRGTPSPRVVARLTSGVMLDDGPARALRVEIDDAGADRATVRLTLAEGRKREVRRLLDAVGHPVQRLIRVSFGPVVLGNLRVGRWRALEAHEIHELNRRATP